MTNFLAVSYSVGTATIDLQGSRAVSRDPGIHISLRLQQSQGEGACFGFYKQAATHPFGNTFSLLQLRLAHGLRMLDRLQSEHPI